MQTVVLSSERNSDGTIKRTRKKRGFDFRAVVAAAFVLVCCLSIGVSAVEQGFPKQTQKLRFGKNGEFKILQVADMHYANGKTTKCLDVLPSQEASCTDLNTTVFIERMISAEKPNLIVFTGN